MTWSNFRHLVAALIAILALIILASTLWAEQGAAAPRFHFVQRDQIDHRIDVTLIKDTLTGSCYALFISINQNTNLHGRSAASNLERVLCANGR